MAGAPPDIAVDAIDLARDYKSNARSADDKYKTRVLIVTGTVDRAGKDAFGTDDPEDMSFTTPMGPIEAYGDVKSLKHGRKVTLRCEGNGSIDGMPLLNNCSMTK